MKKSHKSFKSDRRKAMLDNKSKSEVDGNSISYKPKKEMAPRYTKNRNQSNDQLKINQKQSCRLANEQEREYHLAQLKAENNIEPIADMNVSIQKIVTAPEPKEIKIQYNFQLDKNILDMNPIKRIIYQSLLSH